MTWRSMWQLTRSSEGSSQEEQARGHLQAQRAPPGPSLDIWMNDRDSEFDIKAIAVRQSQTAAECLAFNWPGSLQADSRPSLHQVNQTATGCGLPSTANRLNITGSRTNEYACAGRSRHRSPVG
jgi:hypothetical protein